MCSNKCAVQPIYLYSLFIAVYYKIMFGLAIAQNPQDQTFTNLNISHTF